MRLASTLVKMFTPYPVGGEATQQIVYRVKGANEVKDIREKRIIDLANGKSIDEILDTMFSQEVRAGAWVVDIGIWRNLFVQSVVKTIGELADLGYIRLEPSIGEE